MTDLQRRLSLAATRTFPDANALLTKFICIPAILTQIITEGKWPAEFRGSIYVPIYKKGDKMDCKNYRTIALIRHASKIVLGIIHQRILSYYEQELSETQAGFRKDNGTRDQIMNLRLICEKQIEHSMNVYCCFIDYSKAFDCVDFELMWRTLLSFGIPKYLVLERPIPKSDCRSRDSSWPNRTPLSAKGRPSRLPTFTNAVQPVQRTYYETCPGEMGRWH